MGGLFGGGDTKVKYPTANNVVDIRTPEAISFEDDLRKYFRGVLSKPNMGYTARQTFNPMELYNSSLTNRSDVINSATGGNTSPWKAINPNATGRWGRAEQPSQVPQSPAGRQQPPEFDGAPSPSGNQKNQSPQETSPVDPRVKTPFGLLTPSTPHFVPDWSTLPPGTSPGAALSPPPAAAGSAPTAPGSTVLTEDQRRIQELEQALARLTAASTPGPA